MLGLGGAWFQPEHAAYGVDFGTGVAERLDWLEEAAGLIRALLDGEEVSHLGPNYRTHELRLAPPPTRSNLPMMIGGVGERRTLRTVARYADMLNAYGGPDELRHKAQVLRRHCEKQGRDPLSIEFSGACKPFIRDSEREAQRVLEYALSHNRTAIADIVGDDSFCVGTPEQVAERMLELRNAGFTTFIAQLSAPYYDETIERFVGEVKPMVDGA